MNEQTTDLTTEQKAAAWDNIVALAEAMQHLAETGEDAQVVFGFEDGQPTCAIMQVFDSGEYVDLREAD